MRADRVLVLPDGHTIVAGVSTLASGANRDRARNSCDGDLALVGLDARGRVDAGFGDRGRLRRSAGDGCVSEVKQLEHDRRGGVLANASIFYPATDSLFGLGEDSSTRGGGLTRLSAGGRVDEDFHGDDFAGFRFAVAPDGSIVDDGARHYRADGRRVVDARADLPVDLDTTVAAQPDGAMLFLGVRARRVYRTIAVARLTADAKRDRSFGRGGVATADAAPGRPVDTHPEFLRLLATPDGGSIATGITFGGTSTGAFAIRFDARGRLDRRFGDRGRAELGPLSASKEVYDVALDAGGRLLAIGSSGAQERRRRLFVLRLDRRGRPDRSFGDSGLVWLAFMRAPRGLRRDDVNRANRGAALIAGRRGTIVATTWLTDIDSRPLRSLAFRLRPGGALDRRFGRGGIARLGRLG